MNRWAVEDCLLNQLSSVLQEMQIAETSSPLDVIDFDVCPSHVSACPNMYIRCVEMVLAFLFFLLMY